MDFQSIVKTALALLGKREQLVSLVKDAIDLFNRAKTLFPELASIVQGTSPASIAAIPEMNVTWLQESLNKLVDANLEVDGKFGPATQEAVAHFQMAHGLTVDKWPGVLTQAAIVDALK